MQFGTFIGLAIFLYLGSRLFGALAGAFSTWLYVGLGLFVFSGILCVIQFELESIFGTINWAAIFNPVVCVAMIVGGVYALIKWGDREYKRQSRFP